MVQAGLQPWPVRLKAPRGLANLSEQHPIPPLPSCASLPRLREEDRFDTSVTQGGITRAVGFFGFRCNPNPAGNKLRQVASVCSRKSMWFRPREGANFIWLRRPLQKADPLSLPDTFFGVFLFLKGFPCPLQLDACTMLHAWAWRLILMRMHHVKSDSTAYCPP